MKRSVSYSLVALVVTVMASALPAQEVTSSPTPPATVGGDLGIDSRNGVDSSWRSPRATMRTFLEAFYVQGEARLGAAASCLDLSELPIEVRPVRGRELATKLKAVIDRTRYVEFDAIPAHEVGPPYVFLRTADGEVVIARITDGRWLFSAGTVAGLDHLHRAVEVREVVSGVSQQAPEVVSPATWLRSLVPDALRRQLFVLETWQWLGLLVVIMAGVVAGRVTVAVSRGAIDGFMRRRLVALNLDLLASAMRPGGVLVMVAIWGLGILWLGLPVAAMRLYMDAVKVVAIIAAVVTAYMLVNVLVDVVAQRAARTESGFDDLLVPLIGKSLKVFVVAVGLLLIAGNLRVDVTGLVAGLGLGGLAFALAAKDTVSNLFGSLTVLLDRPFQVGDWVVVGDVEGTVEGLGFRSTRIRTFYNSLITLPNTNLISASVDNLGARAYRRWKTTIAVTYDTPPEAVDAFCEGVRELIREHPYTRKDYFHVYLNDFGDSAVEILLYMFFMTPDWATELRERHRLGVDIMRLAAELGVEFAFPTRTLYMRAQEWAAPEAAGERYPEAVARLESDARETARDLARGTLGGEVPPPVSFPISEQENRGEADE